MGRLRRFADSQYGQWFLSGLAALYIHLIYRSNRWERVGYDIADRLLADHRRAIICFWHGRLLMMPYAMRGDRQFHILVSDHRDGRLIARTVRRFGIGIITGSSSREPVQALYRVAEVCRAYGLPCVTPDGPRGPCMRAAMGPVLAAEMAEAVLVPVSYATSRRRIFPSWDRFLLPLPFGRGVFVVGGEIDVTAGLDATGREAVRLRLEEALHAVTREADRRAGHRPAQLGS
ncbi:MAG TPA: lysophospholipid acyltransferase family protein [Candidatus Udaeobacter sp.]|nr:lysophospholipid acyltransferase family protein [Candidatus Udaeobacter sp.]